MVGNPANGGEGGYVELSVGVVLPDMKEATRTMAVPAIERLHLLVFDDNGLLSEAVPAKLDTLQNTVWGETSAPTYFKVKLARTDYKRTIHFVANSPIANYPMSTEGNILTSLVVSGQQDAYWQRVVLPNGITGTQGKDANGNIIYVPTDDVKAALTNVPLVRNHSRVKVVNAIPNDGISKQLTGLEFVLVNIPASGTVVPFNNNSGEFVNFTDDTDYAELDAANYDGFEPANRDLINDTFTGGALNCENGTDWVTATADANSGYHYLYERNQKLEPAYVIVRGIYDTDTTPTYYKIDIINDKGVSYNLLRNIQYTVNITNVLGSGFATAEEAYNAGPTNNLNFSVETKNLLNLSDGESAFYVEYTQKVINQSGATVTLRYRYVTNLSTGANNTDAVVITKGEGEVISGDIADGDGTTDGDGWNTMSFTAGTIPAEGESAKTQIVTLTAGSFARNVEFILTRPYTLMLDVSEKVGDKLGSSVISSLILEERLPMGIFPLEFIIVAENDSLSPNASLNTLPVVTGLNVNGTPGGQHFGYKVTYEWDQYYTVSGGVESYNTTIPLYFKTNQVQSSPLFTDKSTVEGIDCYAYNQYHNIANDEYWIHVLYGLQLAVSNFTESTATTSFQLNTSNQSIVWPDSGYFDFDILSEHTLTGVTDNSGNAVTGASIVNGGKTLRITQAAYNAARNYTLTFSASNILGTTIAINNTDFGLVDAIVEKPKVTWEIRSLGSSNSGYNYMNNNNDYTLRISLPENVTAEQLTGMKINVESYRTTVRIAGSNISDGNSYSLTITDTNVTNGYVDVTIRATRGNTYTGATFSLTLTGPDGVDMPASFNFQIGTDNNGRYQLLN